MKMYLNEQQTAKLIELGFEKPRLLYFGNNTIGHYAYTIGELIEILPNTITIDETTYSKVINKNEIFYYSWELETYAFLICCDIREDLIDNLYDMCIKLQKEGAI